jgi:hypothetical protein
MKFGGATAQFIEAAGTVPAEEDTGNVDFGRTPV